MSLIFHTFKRIIIDHWKKPVSLLQSSWSSPCYPFQSVYFPRLFGPENNNTAAAARPFLCIHLQGSFIFSPFVRGTQGWIFQPVCLRPPSLTYMSTMDLMLFHFTSPWNEHVERRSASFWVSLCFWTINDKIRKKYNRQKIVITLT